MPGIVLSQPQSAITRVKAVAARDQLDRVGNHLAADEAGAACRRLPIVMPSEMETVLNSIGVPPAWRMPSLTCSASVAEVVVARADLNPCVGHADDRLAERRVVEADAFSIARAPARCGPSVMAALFLR